jgi:hypothetical protein
MSDFIVIDSHETVLFRGAAGDPREAIAFAKSSNQYNQELAIGVHKVETMTAFSPYEHANIEAREHPCTVMAPDNI